MRILVAAQIGGRNVTETVEVPNETRQAFRMAIGDIACRLELSTYGPPSPVEEMTMEDQPVNLGQSFARGPKPNG